MIFRRFLATAAFSAALLLGGCNMASLGPDIGIGPTLESGGWTGLPIGELLTRPTLDTQVLAVCFSTNCPEAVALMAITARGQDAVDLRRTLRNPNSLATDVANARKGARGKRPKVDTQIDSTTSGPFQRITIRMSRPDKPENAVHGVIIARDNGNSISAVIAIAERDIVAEANAASAAQELL